MAGRGVRGWLTEGRVVITVVTVLLIGALAGGGIWLSQSLKAAGADTVTAKPSLVAVSTIPVRTASASSGTTGADFSGQVQLTGWKLTLPVDSSGNPGGVATETKASAVDPWLIRNMDGSVTFWAPANGAKAPGSEQTRTELMADTDFLFGSGAAHTLSATASVNQVPTGANDVCIGQIHGGDKLKTTPFVMLHYHAGAIVAMVYQALRGTNADSITLLTGVPLNARFSFTITDRGNGTLAFSATYKGRTQQATKRPNPVWVNTDERFQAGDFQQALTGRSATDGGRITFYDLSAS